MNPIQSVTRGVLRALSVTATVALTATLVGPLPAAAAPYRPGRAQHETPVAGTSVAPAPAERQHTGTPFAAAAPVWPAAQTADVDPGVRAQGLGAGQNAPAATRAGATPVWITGRPSAPTRATVRTYDHATSTAAGVDGLILRVSGAEAATVAVDYTGFRGAHGADWATRLRLSALPECALTTPDAPACRPTPLASRNDTRAGTVSAAVPARESLLSLSAGTASGSGDYAATPLAPSALWSAGSNTGGFSWTYPMRTPPSLGGPAPQLKLSYSSASVDGQMAASNNQPGWAGEGFDLDPGYIERHYKPCSDDMGTGANNADKTGDQCWVTDNATLSFGAHGGELIKDPVVADRWRTRGDDDTLVERKTGAANGARNGEYWVVTTADGVRYTFGAKPASNSTFTVPVAGNNDGEPCHAAAFADSFCTQGYQWHLDGVQDPQGNTMTYVYTKERNKYGRNNKDTDLVDYDRGGYLSRIDYGTRADRTEAAPMQVVFGVDDRCLSGCATHDATHWPDVPWDEECTKSPCKIQAPTFWGTKRLATVTTRVGGRDVDVWTLTHSFPDPGDGTRAGLWLERIAHAGKVGGTAATPDVTFGGVQMSNRVDTYNDQYAAMKWWRVQTIKLETGGKITVRYSDPDCVAGTRVPDANALQDNHLLCYPVWWQPEGKTDRILDFFHKYLVTDVTETDLVGGAPRTLTHYDYLGEPGWHYADDDGLVKAKYKTWSVWRGYPAVRTVKGDPGERTVTEARYFRGMDGDHLPTGTRSVSLPAITVGAVPAAPDADALAGMTRETITYNGVGGPEVTATVSEPWQSPPTASRTINGDTVYARHTQVAVAHTRTALDRGRGYRTTSVASTFEDTYGTVTQVEDRGDESVAGDETCTLSSYARNPGAWLVVTPNRIEKYGVDCAKAKAGTYADADVFGDNRMSFDQQAFGAAPVRGLVTRDEELSSLAGGRTYATTARSDFDSYGRVVANYDQHGQKTATAYTPSAGGPVTASTTTSPLGWQSTATVEPAWGVTLATVDVNGRRSALTYDPLGRLTSLWQPGRDRATQSANIVYDYLPRDNNQPSAVTTSTLTPDGGYQRVYSLYDSLGRLRQTQSPDGAGGPNAVIADVLYDSTGRPARNNTSYLSTAGAGTTLFRPATVIPAQTVATFDGAGRLTAEILMVGAPAGGSPGGTEKWRTTTGYGGDRTDLTPPAGGVVASTVTDARGHVVELRQYHQGVPAGSPDPSGYDASTTTFDNRDLVTRITDPSGAHRDLTYDLRARPVRTVDPDGGVTDTVFTDAGDIAQVTDARGTVALSYDALGRKVNTRTGSATGPKIAEWTYDTLASGTKVNGQLVRSTRYVNGLAYTNEVTGYTVDYKPTGNKFTIPTEETGLAGSYSYAFTFKEDGSPYTTRIPAAGDLKLETLTFGYDAQGQQKSIRDGYGTAPETDLVTQTGYTSYGEVGSYQLRNNDGKTVDVTRTYETDTRRLAQIWTSKQTGPTTVSDVRLSYDPAGNVTRSADLTSGDTQCFRTDQVRRLADAWTPGNGDCGPAPTVGALGGPAPYWQSYGYDLAGNRTSLVEHGTGAGDRTTTAAVVPGTHLIGGTTTTDSAGTRTAGYTYTPAGDTRTRPTATNGTQTLNWDVEGHLADTSDGSGTSTYIYGADGNRLIRIDPTGKTLYLPGQEVRYTTVGGAKTATRYYSHAGNTVAMRGATGVTWVVSDQHGTANVSVNAVTQAVGTKRDTPFGGSRGTTGTWPGQYDKGFLGGTVDPGGSTHLGGREYDPGLGRFLSQDPIAHPDDPQQDNGYAYGNNNPVTFTDPSGLGFWSAVCDTVNDLAETAQEVIDRTNAPMFALGVGMMIIGGLSDGIGGALCVTGVGAPLGAALLVGGTYVANAGAAIAITAVAAPNIAYAVSNSGGGGGSGGGDSAPAKPAKRQYEDEANKLRGEHAGDTNGAPLTEENAYKALDGGPEGSKPTVGEKGAEGADIKFEDADGNVVAEREVKTTGRTNTSNITEQLKKGSEQVHFDGEIFYQVPEDSNLGYLMKSWRSTQRGDLSQWAKVRVRFVSPAGRELGTFNLGTRSTTPVVPADPPPAAPRLIGRCNIHPEMC